MRLFLFIVAAAALLLAALAVVTVIGTGMIERAHPPQGRFVAVDGGRLHILELGDPASPAVVLLHGASGNLGDMRLSLGERLTARYRVILIDRPGHGWSERPGGEGDASPARQAAIVHQALGKMGVTRAIILGHSWAGAMASAYALAYPSEVAGLVLLAPVTHPWPGGVSFLNHLVTAPVIGLLVAHTLVMPAGYFLVPPGVRSVFSPLTPPAEYVERTGVRMILRPREFIANAQDLVPLKAFVTAQAPRYGEIKGPVAIIASENDTIVITDIHARAIAAQAPRSDLLVLPSAGHMVNYGAADAVIRAIDKIAGAR